MRIMQSRKAGTNQAVRRGAGLAGWLAGWLGLAGWLAGWLALAGWLGGATHSTSVGNECYIDSELVQ